MICLYNNLKLDVWNLYIYNIVFGLTVYLLGNFYPRYYYLVFRNPTYYLQTYIVESENLLHVCHLIDILE